MTEEYQEWFVDFEIFFIFEIETQRIRHLLPEGVYPVEVRPGMSLFSCLVVNFREGSCGTLPALTEVMFNLNVQPDLSIDMLLPKFCFHLISFISSEEAGRRHSGEVNRMPVYPSEGLKIEIDRERLRVRVEDRDGLIFALRVTHPSPTFERRRVSTQFSCAKDGDVYLGKLYWGVAELMEQQRHLADCAELNVAHPFWKGVDVSTAECYMQMVTPGTVDAREQLFTPRKVRENGRPIAAWPTRDARPSAPRDTESYTGIDREGGASPDEERRSPATAPPARPRIAIIGSGMSAMAAGWTLAPHAEVTMFERDDRAGGHSYSKTLVVEGREITTDIGVFAVIPAMMPNIFSLLARPELSHVVLDAIPCRFFSVWIDRGGVEHAFGNTPSYQRLPEVRRIWTPEVRRDAARFMMHVTQPPESDLLETLDSWFARHGYTEVFQKCLYLLTSTVLSFTKHRLDKIPLLADLPLLQHSLLSFFNETTFFRFVPALAPVLEALSAPFRGRIATGTEVLAVWPREGGGVTIETRDRAGTRRVQTFDGAIYSGTLALAPRILDNPNNPHFERQNEVLSLFRMEKKFTYVHRDDSIVPGVIPRDVTEAVVNDERTGRPAVLHYNLRSAVEYEGPPIWITYTTDHPLDREPRGMLAERVDMTLTTGTIDSLIGKTLLHTIQGLGDVWYCGESTTAPSWEHVFVSGAEIATRACGRASYPFQGGTLAEANARRHRDLIVQQLMFPSM
jgi:uncharacterized protein